MNVRVDKFRYVKAASVIQAQTNCSLCACAGAITHGSGQLFTSGMVARSVPFTGQLAQGLGADDGHLQHSQTFGGKGWMGAERGGLGTLASIDSTNTLQANGIATYAMKSLGLSGCMITGNGKSGQRTLGDAKAYMIALADNGFIFCVLADGHWNFAHRVGGAIQFIDYQTDHPQLGGTPTVGTDFQKALGGGNLGDNNNAVVVAFQVRDHFPAGPVH